jgi:hypothetical protein
MASSTTPPSAAAPSAQQKRPASLQPIIVSGPSGVGKGTLLNMLMDRHAGMFSFSISRRVLAYFHKGPFDDETLCRYDPRPATGRGKRTRVSLCLQARVRGTRCPGSSSWAPFSGRIRCRTTRDRFARILSFSIFVCPITPDRTGSSSTFDTSITTMAQVSRRSRMSRGLAVDRSSTLIARYCPRRVRQPVGAR